ncbi:hypothetical protein DID78_04915 [Candidatus Marinamargulisbacteria bacterium SCGC AG-343-D04]|nr:hypothetical protein DID78_04915 [Candidatus Marinamargulisbacteria bacterium SCGC AG-343-D04]
MKWLTQFRGVPNTASTAPKKGTTGESNNEKPRNKLTPQQRAQRNLKKLNQMGPVSMQEALEVLTNYSPY